MSDAKPVRPPQVTIAGWMVVAGSVLVVLMAFSSVADVRSLQTREAIEAYLAEPPGSSLDLSVQAVQTALRIMAMVAAACAAATAILGWSALQRSKGARVALSALAVPLFVSGLLSGGVASAVVCAAIVMLWFQPARDWFDGRTPPPRPTRPERPAWPGPVAPGGPGEQAGRDPLLDLPPPTRPPLHPTPYGSASSAQGMLSGAQARTAQADPVAQPRPAAVRAACILTWACASFAFVLLAVTLVVMLGDSDALIAEARAQNPDLSTQGITDGVLTGTVVAICVLVMAWSAGAMALALLAWRRTRWAALGLVVSGAVAALVCLVVLVASILMIIPLAACSGAVALMLRPEARQWYAAPPG